MKRQLLPAIALGLALLLPTQALACVAVPAKTWKGAMQTAALRISVSNTAFTNNGCKWTNPALNGADAIVFDVASHRGLQGKVTWTTDAPLKPDALLGSFRTASCGAIPNGQWSQPTSGKALAFTFPSNAKWLIVQTVTNVPSKDIKVTITSPGRKCR